MNFDEAKNYILPFGAGRDKSIDQMAETDKGLAWLDWLRGQYDETLRKKGLQNAEQARCATHSALVAYLDDPTIARDVERIARGR